MEPEPHAPDAGAGGRATIDQLRAVPATRRAELLDNRLRQVVTVGETLLWDPPRGWADELGHPARLVNVFGQTETGLYAAFEVPRPIPPLDGPVPAGMPIGGAEIRVLGDDGAPVAADEAGELWVSVGSIGREYVGDPEQTAERFLRPPGEPADGCLEHLGRSDAQVQIRGQRVELDEVEAALLALPGVRQAAVVSRELRRDHRQLVAFVVAPEESGTSAGLRRQLSMRLPDHMVPAAVRVRETLPRTPTGKVDRAALAEIAAERRAAGPDRDREVTLLRPDWVAAELPADGTAPRRWLVVGAAGPLAEMVAGAAGHAGANVERLGPPATARGLAERLGTHDGPAAVILLTSAGSGEEELPPAVLETFRGVAAADARHPRMVVVVAPAGPGGLDRHDPDLRLALGPVRCLPRELARATSASNSSSSPRHHVVSSGPPSRVLSRPRWVVRYESPTITHSGPGNPGTARCTRLPARMNARASSPRYRIPLTAAIPGRWNRPLYWLRASAVASVLSSALSSTPPPAAALDRVSPGRSGRNRPTEPRSDSRDCGTLVVPRPTLPLRCGHGTSGVGRNAGPAEIGTPPAMVPSWSEQVVSERDQIPERIGRYVVRGRLGRGSMGSVYDAVDPELDRPVAVKVIDPDRRLHRVGTDELATRFVREARLAARIVHPGVVTVHDAGRDGETLYLVMERVDGAPLSHRLERGPRPSRGESLELAAQAAEALAAAHDLGVVHRDVKPSNLMLTADGRVKVADFGVAKAIGEDTGLTTTGGTVGSPAYMAPEQVRGETLDGRADLFSLGAVLYELLLGRRPFPAESITTLVYQILHHDPLTEPADLDRLGAPLAGLLRDCLAKAPSDRFADGRTLAARLRALAGAGEQAAALPGPVAGHHELAPTLVAEPEPVSAPPTPATRRRWWRWPAAAAVVLLAAAAVVVVVSRSRVPSPAAGAPAVHSSGLGTDAPSTTPPTARDEEATPVPPADGESAAAPPAPAPPTATPTRSSARTVPTRSAAPASRPTPPIRGMYYTPGGVEFHVDPETALIEVDGELIGTSDEWDGVGGGRVWRFAERRGVHYVKISAPGHDAAWVRITVTPVANEDPVEVEVDLEPSR